MRPVGSVLRALGLFGGESTFEDQMNLPVGMNPMMNPKRQTAFPLTYNWGPRELDLASESLRLSPTLRQSHWHY